MFSTLRKTGKGALAGVALMAAGLMAAHAETFEWQFGNPWPANHPATGALTQILDGIRARSDGRLDIQMVHLDTIGFKQADLLRVVDQGATEMGLFVPFYVRRDAPMLANVVPTGGLIEPEDNLRIADIQRDYAEKILLDNSGIVLPVRFFNRGGRELVLIAPEEINSLDGLKGKKLRHFEALGLKAFDALGVAAQTLPQAELYLALRTGVVDAAIHGLTNVVAQSMWEVTCCFSDLTPFAGQGAPYGFIFKEETWNSLPDDLKQIVRDVTEEDWAAAIQEWRSGAEDKAAKAKLVEEGMKELAPFSVEDRATLQKVVFEVWQEECATLGADAVEMCTAVIDELTRN